MAAVVGKLLRNDLVKAQLCHRSQKVYFPCIINGVTLCFDVSI